jgi:hypothetical protein
MPRDSSLTAGVGCMYGRLRKRLRRCDDGKGAEVRWKSEGGRVKEVRRDEE